MPLTNWQTWVSGATLTAAQLNTDVRDNGRWLSHNATGGAPMCRVYRSTSQTGISSGAVVTFDSERFDVGAMHDTSSNTSRITIPTGGGGKYLFGCSMRIAFTASSANAELDCFIYLNNTTPIATTGTVQEAVAGRTWRPDLTSFYQLAAADYLEVQVQYTNASNVDVVAASNYSPEFWAVWLGE